MLNWLVETKKIDPHIPVFDKSKRKDGSFSREDFIYDTEQDCYTCPGGKRLKRFRTNGRAVKAKPPKDNTYQSRAKTSDCSACTLKPICCPKGPLRKVPRSFYEAARDRTLAIALTDAYQVSRDERKKVEMLFAHLKSILKLDRLRLRGPTGANDDFLLAATAQNLRKMAKLHLQSLIPNPI